MSSCFLKVLNISITAGWLVLAVVLLRFALRKAPKWVCCMLWGLVALRLVLPFTIESRFSLLPSGEPVQTGSATAASAANLQTATVPHEQIVLHSGFAAVDDAVNSVMTTAGTDTIASIQRAAAWIWLMGVGAMLLYATVSFLHMKHKVRASIEKERNVYVCDDVVSPFILGAIRPVIYLPSGIDEKNRAHVLAHERAHIQRLDHLIKPLGFLLLSIHWFNPLIWFAFVLLSRDIEFACDEKVIARLDVEGRAAYSHTLLAFSRLGKAITVCPVAFGEVGVKERVKSVLGYKKPAIWVVLVALIAGAAVAVCFLTAPTPAQTAQLYVEDAPLPSYERPWPKEPVKGGGENEVQPEPETERPTAILNLLTCVDQQCIEAD